MSLFDPILEKTRLQDQKYLSQTELPIVTISATYHEDLKGLYGLPEKDTSTDIVLSRAHYSMALGVAMAKWQDQLDPAKAWIVDPANYVTAQDWYKLFFSAAVGQTLARQPLLKKIKDLIDRFGRQKNPISASITNPLLFLTQTTTRPILSFHITAGNILARQGKTVWQMITDPHVRPDYLSEAHRPNIGFLVFDQQTKTNFLEKARLAQKIISPAKVIVTGPPVDPRIVAARKAKHPWRQGPVKICLTTGGLGTNKAEIKTILDQLLPALKKRPSPYQLLVYAATHRDLAQLVRQLAKKYQIPVNDLHAPDPANYRLAANLTPAKIKLPTAQLNLIYHPQIVDANELLIRNAFPWADLFITKPSGDMAYDAAASGSALLTLAEWGEWEHNIREIFSHQGVAQAAQAEQILDQLAALTSTAGRTNSWLEQAMTKALNLAPLFLTGANKIIRAASRPIPQE